MQATMQYYVGYSVPSLFDYTTISISTIYSLESICREKAYIQAVYNNYYILTDPAVV